MELVSTFSERLKEALDGELITEFADKTNISKQSISAYIHGKRKPKTPVIKLLANELNVNEAWLQGYDVPRRSDSQLQPYTHMKKTIIAYYRSLNWNGQEKVLAYLDDLNSSGKYKSAIENQEFTDNKCAEGEDDDRPIILPGQTITKDMLRFI